MDLSQLNPQQAEAVRHLDGPILVLAGAGSGKTRVITTRIAYLIDQGVRPENILGLTFTNKAAAEMRARVARLIDFEAARLTHLGTFHALGAWLLRREIGALGFDPRFTILDESDRRRTLRQVLKELNLSAQRNERAVLAIISRAKNARTSPAELPDMRFNPEMPRAQRVFKRYNQALRNLNAVDFDDLLLLPTRIFEDNPQTRQKYRQRFRYVLIDEYQDTNAIQLNLLDHLVGPPYNVMAVGDDDQSIYAFRGAVADNIMHFGELFASPKVVALEQNYRSVSSILDVANAVITRNSKRHDKRLWSELGPGAPVEAIELDNDFDEADWIARRILAESSEGRRPLHQFAALYRANPQLDLLEEALRKHELPYRILGGQSIFDRKEIKDLLAYLRLLTNPRDELGLRRIINVPSRGVGTTSVARLDEQAKASGRALADVIRDPRCRSELPPRAAANLVELFETIDIARARLSSEPPDAVGEIVSDLLERIELEAAIRAAEKNPNLFRIRWQGVCDIVQRIGAEPSDSAWRTLEEYIQKISLETGPGSAREEDPRGRVTLSTIHSSKGLEFPFVFLCGMIEDLLPHARSKEEAGGIAEERRLCYVGMTRAQRRLFLTYPRTTITRNERLRRVPSRFLDEIPAEMLVRRRSDQPSAWEEEQDKRNAEHFAGLRALLEDR